jgi:hypothetical protein
VRVCTPSLSGPRSSALSEQPTSSLAHRTHGMPVIWEHLTPSTLHLSHWVYRS